MTANIVYKGGLRTRMTHIESGTEVTTDAPKDNQGNGESFSPTDLTATSLGSCMLSIMGIKARQMEIENKLIGTRVEVTKVMYSEPRRIGEVHVRISLSTHDFSEKEKTILTNAAYTCPVAFSLHPDIKQMVDFVW